MNKKYFINCKTLEELKKEYRKLAMKHHPDMPNGNTRIMQEVNAEYECLFNILKNQHNSNTNNTKTTEKASDFMDIINDFIHYTDITIEICGSWIWISGNTKPIREELKKSWFCLA